MDSNWLINMLHLFQSAVLFPRLKWLFRRLSKLPPNPLFRYWFYLVYADLLRRSEKRSLVAFIRYTFANWRFR